ncbi:porin, partial [Cohaesibacter celericrescens]
ADLPVAEPVDYVRVCDAYGAGYFFIPGTDTCLKISGEVLLKVHTNGFHQNLARSQHLYDFDTETNLTFTAREETEMGTLSAVIELDDIGETTGGSGTAIDKAYLQLGGFYAGLTDSLIEFNGGQAYDDFDTSHGDLNAIGYKMDLGNGVTAAIALEEYAIGISQTVAGSAITGFIDDGAGGGTAGDGIQNGGEVSITSPTTTVYTVGRSAPSLAASLAVEQGWGSVAVGASLFQVRYADPTISTDYGYTIGGDASFNVMEALTLTMGAGYSLGAPAPVGSVAAAAGTLNSSWEVSGGLVYAFADNFDFKVGAGYYSFNDRTAVNNDLNRWGVSVGALYTPIKNLEIEGKVGYQKVDFSNTYTANTGIRDWDDVAAELTIKRTF